MTFKRFKHGMAQNILCPAVKTHFSGILRAF